MRECGVSMKKKFMENKKLRLIAVFLITAIIVTGFSFAWFFMRQTQSNKISVSNFKVTLDCYLGDTKITDSGLITLSTDSRADNYIGNLKVNVNYEGDGAGYLRVRMAHKFYRADDKAVQHPADIIPYAVDSDNWKDNREEDSCYYYNKVLNAEENTDPKTVTVFDGLSEGETLNIGSEFQIQLAIEADMVQVNRYPQIWGITELPWEKT